MYGLPADFPGAAGSRRDPLRRATAIEETLHKEVVQIAECRSERFLPHIQPHEFEALLFSNTSQLVRERPEWARWAEELAAVRKGAASPEHSATMWSAAPTRRPDPMLYARAMRT